MSQHSSAAKPALTLTVDAAPNPVDAGAKLSITARVLCDPAVDLTGDTLDLRDGDGALIGSIEFTEFDDESETSMGSVMISAPSSLGDYSWSAKLSAFEAEDLSFDATEVAVPFSVTAHSTKINVWDAPSAIGLGERFLLKVGVKCSCGCSMAGRTFTVHDQNGTEVGTGTLGESIWPDTQALYFAEIELTEGAGEAGLCSWHVKVDPDEGDLPHSAAQAQFGLTFVRPPEHIVRVQTFDRDKGTPLVGAQVAMHPYRATTGEDGVAELRVPKGKYTLFVSARKYVSDRAMVQVEADLLTRAELAAEVRRERI